ALPTYRIRVTGGDPQPDIRPPAMPDDNRVVHLKLHDHVEHVAPDRLEAVIAVGLVRLAVPAQVERDDPRHLGQQRGDEVPDVACAGKPMQQQDGPPASAPVTVVEAEVVDGECLVDSKPAGHVTILSVAGHCDMVPSVYSHNL